MEWLRDRSISTTKARILGRLQQVYPEGILGIDLSGDRFHDWWKRGGAIYTQLAYLQRDGLVRAVWEDNIVHPEQPHRRFYIRPAGKVALAAYLDQFGGVLQD